MASTKSSSGMIPIKRGAYPEFTWTAVIVGWVVGSLIAVSIGYAALILGFSIEGSELAAILGWGILRGLMGRTSIVENNINQTIASAVNGASSGIMFSVPALFILSKSEGLESLADFNIPLMILSCITGCILGLAFVIPLRKQMIDFDRLPYPGGIAVATILKSPGAGVRKAVLLLGGALVSAGIYLAILNVVGEEDWGVGEQLGLPPLLNITIFLSVMTVGVGYLSGKGGFWFGAGGFICYWVMAPMLAMWGADTVRQEIDPLVRTSVIQGAEGDLKEAAGLLTEIAPAEAAQLSALLARDDSKQASTENPEAAPQRIWEDKVNATAIFEVAQSLWRRAQQAKDDEVREQLLKATDSIVKATHVHQVLGAIKFVDQAPPEIAKQIREVTSSRAAIELAQNRSLIDEDQGALLLAATEANKRYHGSPNALRLKLFRPTGIGMLIGAAIGGILAAFPLIFSAFRAMNSAAAQKSDGRAVRNDEMPIKFLYGAVAVGAVVLVMIAFSSVEEMTIGLALTMAVLGTVWVWVAGVIVSECVGRTNWSPLSGMTLIAVTIIVLIAKSGLSNPAAIMSSIVMGAAICLAISQASDMMLDLKSGYLVGAIPKRQQMAQFVGCWLGPIIVIFLLIVLHNQYEIGSDRLPAPQAQALAAMTEGIMNDNVPTYRYAAGAGLGGLLALSGLGGIGVLVGLGFYMPFNIVLTYTLGNLLRVGTDKFCGQRFAHEIGIPIAAGLIVGEALVGVGNAFWQVFFSTPPSFDHLDAIFNTAALLVSTGL